MDIAAIIKENLPDLPEGVEISDKAIKLIAKEIQSEQGKEFIPKTAYSKQSEKIISLESKISELETGNADADSYKSKVGELEKKIKEMDELHKQAMEEKETEHKTAITAKDTEFSTFKAEVEGKELVSKKRELARKYLVDEKNMNAVVFDKLIHKELDYEKMELDGDSVKSADNYFKEYQEKFAEFISTTTTTGTTTGTPPEGNPTKPEPKTLGEALKEKYNKG